jgi:hypothetical protein
MRSPSLHLTYTSDSSDQTISAHFCRTEITFFDPRFHFFNYWMHTSQKPTYCTEIPLHHILGSPSGYVVPFWTSSGKSVQKNWSSRDDWSCHLSVLSSSRRWLSMVIARNKITKIKLWAHPKLNMKWWNGLSNKLGLFWISAKKTLINNWSSNSLNLPSPMFIKGFLWISRMTIQWIWRLIVYKRFSRRKSKIIEANPVCYLSSLVLSSRSARRVCSLASIVTTPGPSPLTIVRLVNEIPAWICDASQSQADRVHMKFNALRSIPAPNVKFIFLDLVVKCVCLSCDPSGRWYFKNSESIFYSCFSSRSSYVRFPILVHNSAP